MSDRTVRFAVVGLGHISQAAVLPAFEHADGCEIGALVSGDPDKRRELSRRYGVQTAVDYDGYEGLLASGDVDVVYVGTPNHLHAQHTVAAAEHGVHVLCEKPMAVTEEECRRMIDAAADNDVHLMIAYRLHFEPCNLEVAEMVRGGRIGRPRLFSSTFGQDVKPGDVRLAPLEKGGGSVYDMGVYCINAMRYVFGSEPTGVTAETRSREGDERFEDCDEMTSAVLTFPDHRLGQFTSSFGSADTEQYRVVGTEGEIFVEPSYTYHGRLGYRLVVDGEVREEKTFPLSDQFAPELEHMAGCIRRGEKPEPDGMEGLADVRIIRAVYESARTGRRIDLEPVEPQDRPRRDQARQEPPVDEPEEIKASGPSD